MTIKDLIDEKAVEREGLLVVKGLLLLLPFVIAIVFYVREDPFKVLRSYDDYDHTCIFQNEGATAWYKYKKFRSRAHYDSFIMGNSCTMAFRADDWNKYIHGSSFRLFSNAESVGDLYNKLAALDNQKDQPIRNVLIVLDRQLLRYGFVRTGFMHVMPPEVSHIGMLRYQMEYVQGFFNPQFTLAYLGYAITHTYRPSMKGIINPNGCAHCGMSNDAVNPREEQIRWQKERYWHDKEWQRLLSTRRSGKVYPRTIYSLQRSYLLKIKAICDKHHTNVKVVINPGATLIRESLRDVRELRRIFGVENVFDFSGTNDLTMDYHNFYDNCHYRPMAGRKILQRIYAPQQSDTARQAVR
jgi:hypothetical protein